MDERSLSLFDFGLMDFYAGLSDDSATLSKGKEAASDRGVARTQRAFFQPGRQNNNKLVHEFEEGSCAGDQPPQAAIASWRRGRRARSGNSIERCQAGDLCGGSR